MQNDFKAASQKILEISQKHQGLSLVEHSQLLFASNIFRRLDAIKQTIIHSAGRDADADTQYDADNVAVEMLSILGIDKGN